jgi:hypothetical protein
MVSQEIIFSTEMLVAVFVEFSGPACQRVIHGSNIARGYKRKLALVIADSYATHGIETLAGIPRNGIIRWGGLGRKMHAVQCTERVWESFFGFKPIGDHGLPHTIRPDNILILQLLDNLKTFPGVKIDRALTNAHCKRDLVLKMPFVPNR